MFILFYFCTRLTVGNAITIAKKLNQYREDPLVLIYAICKANYNNLQNVMNNIEEGHEMFNSNDCVVGK